MFEVRALFLSGVAVFGGGAILLSRPSVATPAPANSVAFAAVAAPTPTRLKQHRGKLAISRASDGFFYLDGSINGASIRFLVDTGASIVVLTPEDAARAHIATGYSDVEIDTANGTTPMAMTRIDVLHLAGRDLGNVQVAIPQAEMRTSLLGQNALAELGSLTMTRDRLEIAAPSGEAE